MNPSSLLLSLLAVVLLLGACDRPKGAPRNSPGVTDVVGPVAAPAQAPVAEASAPLPTRSPEPIVWDEASSRFMLNGMVLKTSQLWRFDGGTEGFSSVGSRIEAAQGGGLRVVEQAPDSVIRSPRTLAIDGKRYNAVLVRLVRKASSEKWDGSLFYTTAAHGEAAEFHTKPLRGANPVVGETTIMVYDMANLKKGGDDWSLSTITGLRLDLDDSFGGAFLVRQIAVVALPPTATLRPPQ